MVSCASISLANFALLKSHMITGVNAERKHHNPNPSPQHTCTVQHKHLPFVVAATMEPCWDKKSASGAQSLCLCLEHQRFVTFITTCNSSGCG